MHQLTTRDTAKIDEQLVAKMSWAENNQLHAEQLALDATRLLSCTHNRLDDYRKQGFFQRAWGAFSGAERDMHRANQRDLVEMQKYAWRYLNLLNERELLLAHSLITVKNNLLTLQVAEAETRAEIQRMANKVYNRFVALEDRMKRVEVATHIHSWLLTVETLDYDERFSPHCRLLRLVNDFFNLKSADWTPQELRYLQKAIKEVDLPWKQTISLHEFVTGLIDEIDQTGYEQYTALLTAADHSSIPANFVLEHIAVPAYTSLFSVAQHYTHSTDTISALVEHLNCSESEALKKVLMSFIQRNGIDLNAQVPLRDLAIELLSCMGMAHRLHHDSQPYQMDTSASVVLSSNSTPPFIHGWTSAQVQQLQHATARALRCEPIFHDRLRDGNPGPQLVIIPAGRFLMGSPEDEAGRYDDERPHEVVIAQPFALGQYLVTFDEYDRFCAATGREKPLDDWDWGRGRRPVINVDWYDALAYCVWLSEQTGQSYRLPTEAEWEYACRAGTTTPFYFGDTLNTDQANYDGNTTYGAGRKGQYRKQTTPVGQFPANAWGLYDMHGNVYEWTGSDYDEDYSGAEQRYVDASESSARVVRGGSWNSYPYGLRSAYRLRTTPVARYADRGFRLSRSL